MTTTYLVLILGATALFALLSQKIAYSVITMPMLFTFLGWAIGEGGLHLFPAASHESVVYVLGEITLTLLLFSDASRIDVNTLMKTKGIAFRLLLIGLPLCVLTGTVIAHWFNPTLSWGLSFLIAAILSPTDMIVSQLVLTHPGIPQAIRQSINTESGLNDGLVLPFILLAAMASFGSEITGDAWGDFAIRQIVLGPVVGIVIGFVSAKLLDISIARNLSLKAYRGIYFLAVALLAYLLAESIEGNGSMSAFVAGLVFGNSVKNAKSFIREFMEAEGQLLAMVTFLIFGAVMVPRGLHYANAQTVAMALLFLTVARMLPVWLSLSGTGLNRKERLFIGWFGPRGLASILFTLLIVEQYETSHIDSIISCVVLTVLLSIVVHGMSTWPFVAHLSQEKNHGL